MGGFFIWNDQFGRRRRSRDTFLMKMMSPDMRHIRLQTVRSAGRDKRLRRWLTVLDIQNCNFWGHCLQQCPLSLFRQEPCKYLDGLTVVISGRFRYHTLIRKFKETSPKKNNEKQKSGGFSNGKFIIKERL